MPDEDAPSLSLIGRQLRQLILDVAGTPDEMTVNRDRNAAGPGLRGPKLGSDRARLERR